MTFKEYIFENIGRVYEDYRISTERSLAYFKPENVFFSRLERRLIQWTKRGKSKGVIIRSEGEALDIDKIIRWLERIFPLQYEVQEIVPNRMLRVVLINKFTPADKIVSDKSKKGICDVCGNKFKMKRKNSRQCSSVCRGVAHRSNMRRHVYRKMRHK